MKTKLCHIDNNFYHLTPSQAKQICGEFGLPRDGYERIIHADGLSDKYEFGELISEEYPRGEIKTRFKPFDNQPTIRRASILKTPLSWWNGEKVDKGWVWAIHASL